MWHASLSARARGNLRGKTLTEPYSLLGAAPCESAGRVARHHASPHSAQRRTGGWRVGRGGGVLAIPCGGGGGADDLEDLDDDVMEMLAETDRHVAARGSGSSQQLPGGVAVMEAAPDAGPTHPAPAGVGLKQAGGTAPPGLGLSTQHAQHGSKGPLAPGEGPSTRGDGAAVESAGGAGGTSLGRAPAAPCALMAAGGSTAPHPGGRSERGAGTPAAPPAAAPPAPAAAAAQHPGSGVFAGMSDDDDDDGWCDMGDMGEMAPAAPNAHGGLTLEQEAPEAPVAAAGAAAGLRGAPLGMLPAPETSAAGPSTR